MRRFFAAAFITAALAGTLAQPAEAGTIHRKVVYVRVYDPVYRDYHPWNRSENAAYREYLASKHRAYVRYQRQRAAERRAYWHWRHEREERLERR